MATSRTGTAKWKNIRAQALRAAQRDGLTHCPLCRVPLDYENCTRPNGAVGDHIVPHAKGGADHIDNVRIICFTCNSKRAGYDRKRARQRARKRGAVVLETSGDW